MRSKDEAGWSRAVRSSRHALTRLGGIALLAFAAACVHRPPVPLPEALRGAALGDIMSRVVVDPSREEVVVFAGPFRVPAAGDPDVLHGAHMDEHAHVGTRTPMIEFRWPMDALLRGYRLAVIDAAGNEYPRRLIHHLIGVNYDRRQLVYPVSERLFGVGVETGDIVLPRPLGVPLREGTRLGFYVSWNNQASGDLERAYVRPSMPFSPQESGSPVVVLPFYADVNNQVGGKTSFDLPPGETVRSYDFTVPASGELVAAGGHLHDYGVALRLEDSESGKVLFTLDAERDDSGRIHSVEQQVFGIRRGRLRLERGHPYRVVGVYRNPTGRTLPDGGMAHISAIFAPDEPDRWPALDRGDPLFVRDLESLPESLGAAGRHVSEGRFGP